MNDTEDINRKMADATNEEWWHKIMRIEEKFYYGEHESLPWRLKCWWKSEAIPYCVYLFSPGEGFLVETFYNTSINDIKEWINGTSCKRKNDSTI